MPKNLKIRWNNWSPVVITFAICLVLSIFAAYEEKQVLASIYLPGGFLLPAFLPARYMLYCDMDATAINKEEHWQNMRTLPRVLIKVNGAGHLNVLDVPVWRSGGLERYTKAPDGTKRLLIPFAEFDILWPGTYEVRGTFTGVDNKHFLMSVGAVNLSLVALLFNVFLLTAVLLTLWRRKLVGSSVKI